MADETDETDETLLERIRGGDPGALDQLIERHQQKLYRFGMKMCRDPEDAKDVLQDSLLALARSIRDFRGDSSVSTWLYKVARSCCVKKRRSGRSVRTSDSLSTSSVDSSLEREGSETPDESLAAREIRTVLDQAIATLEPAYREVLVLRDIEGLTAPEVAEVVGLTVEAVKSRLHRARLMVRERVAPVLDLNSRSRAARAHCPDVLILFSRHLEGEISADACAEVESHLRSCGACRALCDSLQHSLKLCRASQAHAPVPSAVQASVRVALRELLAAQDGPLGTSP
ncbi:MAG TPA: sigma-70 family RNA polymerase sigma factor [Polyangiaceae bacterium]|nr:sigma-70 family RNA polymerase sigma factor [Polyangiaceae bacterium]